MTTKEQERKALAQIKKIVAGLGEGSYIATAFEGCFEIAEENIENDFGCSMKDRADQWHKVAQNTGEELAEARKRIEFLESRNASLMEESMKLAGLVLSVDDLVDASQLVQNREAELEDGAEKAARDIVRLADEPESKEFRDAVRNHRMYSSTLKYYQDLRMRIDNAIDAQNKTNH